MIKMIAEVFIGTNENGDYVTRGEMDYDEAKVMVADYEKHKDNPITDVVRIGRIWTKHPVTGFMKIVSNGDGTFG